MACNSEEECELLFFDVTVMEKGSTAPYTVPSLPVFTAMLRPVLLQLEDRGGEVFAFNGFMCECGLLSNSLPALAPLVHSVHLLPTFVKILRKTDAYRVLFAFKPGHFSHGNSLLGIVWSHSGGVAWKPLSAPSPPRRGNSLGLISNISCLSDIGVQRGSFDF